MPRALAIDLGSQHVKVAVLERKLGHYELVRLLSAPVPPEAPPEAGPPQAGAPPGEGGAEEDEDRPTDAGTPAEPAPEEEPERPELLGDLSRRLAALAALVEEHGLADARPVAAAYPLELASVHRLSLPFRDRNQVARALPFELEEHVPFEVEGLLLDHRVLGTGEDGSRVLAVLGRPEVMERLVAGLGAVGLDPKFVALDAEALAGLAGEGLQLVVDLGHRRTLLALARDGRLLAARAVLWGGADLTAALQRRFGLSEEAAERWKAAIRLPVPVEAEWEPEDGPQAPPPPAPRDSPERAVAEAAAAALRGELFAEVRAALLLFEEQEGPVEGVLLAGGGAGLAGIEAFAEHELGRPARRLVVEESSDEAGERFALVRGLALRLTGELRGHPFEFRRGAFAHHGNLEVLRGLASFGAVALAAAVVTGLVLYFVRARALDRELGQLEARISAEVSKALPDVPPERLEDPSTAVAILQEKAMGAEERVALLSSAFRGEPPMLGMLKALSEAMPPPDQARIDVTELQIGEKSISMRAETDGFEEASRIEAALQNSERFKQARKADEKKVGDKVVFNLSIPLGEEEHS